MPAVKTKQIRIDATAVDSSAAAQALTLPAATGSGATRYYVNKAIVNIASLAPASGEAINGVTNGTWTFSNYVAGTQFIATDYATGKWSVAVEGASTSTSLSYYQGSVSDQAGDTGHTFTQRQMIGTGITTPDGKTFTLSGGVYEVEFNVNNHMAVNTFRRTSIKDTNTSGTVLASCISGHDGANSEGGGSMSLVIDARAANKVFVVQRTNSSGNGNCTADLTIKQVATNAAVLAGMVTPQPLQRLQATIAGTVPAVNAAHTLTATVGDVTMLASNTITLKAGRTYRLSGTIARVNGTSGTAEYTYQFRDTTNSADLGGPGSLTQNTALGAGGIATALVKPAADMSVQLWLKKNQGNTVTSTDGNSGSVTGVVIVEELPAATVVMPGAVTPQTLETCQANVSGAAVSNGTTDVVFTNITTTLANTGTLFTLKAGRKYHVTAMINANSNTSSSSNINYWLSDSANVSLSVGAWWYNQVTQNTGGGPGGVAQAVLSVASDTQVKVRYTAAGMAAGAILNASLSIVEVPQATVVNPGSVGAMAPASAGGAGTAGYIGTGPTAGQQAFSWRGDGTFKPSGVMTARLGVANGGTITTAQVDAFDTINIVNTTARGSYTLPLPTDTTLSKSMTIYNGGSDVLVLGGLRYSIAIPQNRAAMVCLIEGQWAPVNYPTLNARIVSTTNNNNVPNTSSWTFSFGTTSFSSGMNAAANDITVPVAGNYRITLNVPWAANSTGGRLIGISVGGTQIQSNLRQGQANIGPDVQTLSTVQRLTAGSVVSANAFQNSGGFLSVAAAAQTPLELIVQLVDY